MQRQQGTAQRSVLVEFWTAYGAPAAGSLSNRSISSAACRSWAAWKCA